MNSRLNSAVLSGLLFLLAPLWSVSIAQASDLVLNGSAVYTYLNREYYVAGLYLPVPNSDPEYIRAPATAKRMQLVLRVARWSPRSWSQQWQNNIAINNDELSPDTRLQTALMQFTQFPRNDLQQGDELTVDYQPGGNTRVLLNGEAVIEVPGTELFNYLLNTWIGKLPPSREFRQQILGTDPVSEEQSNSLITHKPSRTGLWSGWIAAEQAAEQRRRQAEESARRVAEQARQAEQQRVAQAEADRQEQQRLKEAAAAQAAELRRQQQEEQQARSSAEKVARERAEQQRRAQEQAVKQQTERLSANRAGAIKSPADVTAEQRYHLQMLQWQLQRQVEAAVVYPAWAKQFAQEGLVELDVTLNRKGEISDVRPRDENVPRLLITETERAAMVAASKTSIPQALAGDAWPLSVRYQFSLAGAAQPVSTMPQPPASLRKTGLSADAKKQQEQEYRTQQTERIRSAIVYPPAARILKKQDKVVFEVVILADGRVDAVREVQASRHRELNQAMHTAIKGSEPFPPIPVGLQLPKITLTIEHDFRL